jgi:hypothetical protein
MVRGTADPSAALGMTKERATRPWKAVAAQKAFFITLGWRQATYRLQNRCSFRNYQFAKTLSSRPERSVVEGPAVTSTRQPIQTDAPFFPLSSRAQPRDLQFHSTTTATCGGWPTPLRRCCKRPRTLNPMRQIEHRSAMPRASAHAARDRE